MPKSAPSSGGLSSDNHYLLQLLHKSGSTSSIQSIESLLRTQHQYKSFTIVYVYFLSKSQSVNPTNCG